MRKYKFFVNFDKEEKWLNDMASRGYVFAKRSFGYEFQRGNPEYANIRIDYRTFKHRADFEDYRALFEDSGWKHIAGDKGSKYQYFKKVGESSSDDIFSDVDSKAARYKRMSEMWLTFACMFIPIFAALVNHISDILLYLAALWLTFACMFIPIFAALVSTGAIDAAAILNPKLLYYTPGLWDKVGSDEHASKG